MIMTELDPQIIKNTQNTLGKIIKKPPLTDRLLTRPPLRFLHDICTAFIKATGLLEGLYTKEELNPDSMKDKDQKLNFLSKLIDYVTIVHKKVLDVKASSIVAGKECDKTNILLAELAACVNIVQNNEEIVNATLKGEARLIRENQKKSESQSAKMQKETTVSNSKVSEKQNLTRTDSSKVSKRKESSIQDKTDSINNTKFKSIKPKEVEKIPTKTEAIQETPIGPTQLNPPESEAVENSATSTRLQRPSSAKGSRKRKEGKNKMTPTILEFVKSQNKLKKSQIEEFSNEQSLQQEKNLPNDNSSMGSTSSRRKASENELFSLGHDSLNKKRQHPTRDRNKDSVSNQSVSTYKASTGQEFIKPSYLIESSDEDNDDYVVEEYIAPVKNLKNDNLLMASGEYSKVVTELAKSKDIYNLDKDGGDNENFNQRVSSNLNEIARRTEKVEREKEIGQLIKSLQKLYKSSQPFGKLTENVEEELDNMQQEFDKWQNEKNHFSSIIQNQDTKEEDEAIENLSTQLADSEARVADYRKTILLTKTTILINQSKIQRLLNMACENI